MCLIWSIEISLHKLLLIGQSHFKLSFCSHFGSCVRTWVYSSFCIEHLSMGVFTDLYVLKFFGEYVKLEPWVTSLCKHMGYGAMPSLLLSVSKDLHFVLLHWKPVSRAWILDCVLEWMQTPWKRLRHLPSPPCPSHSRNKKARYVQII